MCGARDGPLVLTRRTSKSAHAPPHTRRARRPPFLPPVPPQPTDAVPNAKRDGLLLKLLLRRAAAYVELGRTADALGEYEEAHAIAPDNGAVKDALRQLRARA